MTLTAFHWRTWAMYFAISLLAGFGLQNTAVAQSMPNPATIVKPETYVSLDKVPRGRAFEAAVVVAIAKGFHMNSNKPSEDYLIPTTITLNPPAGIKVLDTMYPPGQMKTFTFSPNKPLNVYSDSVTLRLKLTAEASAPLGSLPIPATLRYQACNDTACLPPVKVPVTIAVDVATAGSSAHPAHSDIFSPPAPKH